jgi:hypothetical protein
MRAGQGGVRLSFETVGSVSTEDDEEAAGSTGTRTPFETTFVLFGPADGRWFLWDTLTTNS